MFEMFQLPFMVQAFVVAAITGVLLSYLGVHVVGRGIVFVDLALGQISSLGVAFAAFMGFGITAIPIFRPDHPLWQCSVPFFCSHRCIK